MAQAPSFINYNQSNGLPSNESYYVHQDHEGFVWILTDNGVVRFDGFDFTLYNKQNGLADNVNFSVHPDSKNRLWFRSYSGAVSYFDNGVMKPYKLNKTIRQLMAKYFMVSMVIDQQDSLHLGMSSGFIMDIDSSDSFKTREIANSEFLIDTYQKSNPLLVFKDNLNTITTLKVDGKTRPFERLKNSVKAGNVGAKMFKGRLIAFFDHYLFEIDNQNIKLILDSDKSIISISKDKDEKLWIGFQSGGVSCYDGKNFTESSITSLVDGLSVTSVMQDKDGRYWLSTLEKGIFYIPSLFIKNYRFNTNTKLSAVAFSEQDVYYGNYNGSLYQFNVAKGSELIYKFEAPIISMYYLESVHGILVSTSFDTFLFDLRTRTSKPVRINRPIRGIKKFQVCDDDIIGGNLVGIFQFDLNGEYSDFKETPIKIRSFYKGKDKIFFAPVGGLITSNLGFTQYDTIHYLDNNKVLDISLANDEYLIATAESGLLKLVGDSILNFYENQYIACPLVRMIVQDDRTIYSATECGLVIDKLDAYNKVASSRVISLDNGLINNSVDFLGFSNKSLLCFSPDGISVIDTAGLNRTRDVKFYLKEMLINNLPVSQVDQALPYQNNNLEFRFGFVYFGSGNIRVKHRPSSSFDWIASNQKSIQYFSLGPGQYHPELSYSLNGGPWINIKLTHPFSIDPPWWETLTFQFMVICLLATIIGLVFYVYYQRKVGKIKYLESLRGEKDRISRELHDNIGSRLAYIKLSMHNLKYENNFANKKEMLEKQLGSTVVELRDTIWAINKDIISVNDFADRVKSLISRYNFPGINIDFQFDRVRENFNPQLNPRAVINLYRMVQEALTNSLKHSGSEFIAIHINLDAEDNLIITIKDNGVGFDYSVVNNIDGYGLQSLKSRAEELNAIMTIESKPEQGTEIKIVYSLKKLI